MTGNESAATPGQAALDEQPAKPWDSGETVSPDPSWPIEARLHWYQVASHILLLNCSEVTRRKAAAAADREAFDAVAAQEPHAASGPLPADAYREHLDRVFAPVKGEVERLRAELADSRPASMLQPVDFDDEPETGPLREPQPAPGLAAAMDATAALARVLSWFPVAGTRNEATATRAQLAHAYQDGGLTVPEDLRRFL